MSEGRELAWLDAEGRLEFVPAESRGGQLELRRSEPYLDALERATSFVKGGFVDVGGEGSYSLNVPGFGACRFAYHVMDWRESGDNVWNVRLELFDGDYLVAEFVMRKTTNGLCELYHREVVDEFLRGYGLGTFMFDVCEMIAVLESEGAVGHVFCDLEPELFDDWGGGDRDAVQADVLCVLLNRGYSPVDKVSQEVVARVLNRDRVEPGVDDKGSPLFFLKGSRADFRCALGKVLDFSSGGGEEEGTLV